MSTILANTFEVSSDWLGPESFMASRSGKSWVVTTYKKQFIARRIGNANSLLMTRVPLKMIAAMICAYAKLHPQHVLVVET